MWGLGRSSPQKLFLLFFPAALAGLLPPLPGAGRVVEPAADEVAIVVAADVALLGWGVDGFRAEGADAGAGCVADAGVGYTVAAGVVQGAAEALLAA